ncbi:FAD-dependent oxidoreductase [Patescibacteria group bacterium]|nr:FAD-dependent oxidoreductase [Patescibacteria group bacterium]
MDKTLIPDRQRFDVIVIGAGSGGLNIAAFINRVGLTVLLIDKDDAAIGGDCLNFGCVPSKALIHVAREVAAARRAAAYGITVSGAVDWKRVRARVLETQTLIREHENAAWFRSKGMTVVLGEATFIGRNSVRVGDHEYTGKRIVLATGSRPRTITGQGIERVARVLNNESLFTMEELPRRLLVLGAGPIGIENAQALGQLGSQVVVVDPGKQILGKEGSDMAAIVQEQLEAEGMQFHLGYRLKEFTGPGTGVVVSEAGEEMTIEFDAVFVAIGRVLNTEGLGLDAAGIKVDERGKLVVDRYLRTTNRRVVVCGDVAGNFQFTHAAEMHAGTIIRNLFSPLKKPFSGDHISWVTYTTPEVATFGLSAAQLAERGIVHEVLVTDFLEDDRAITDDYRYGKQKLFIGPKGEILGGTMVAPGAGELMQELVLARAKGFPLSALFSKTYAYPTATRINKRSAGTYVARQLTPWRKRLLRFLFR